MMIVLQQEMETYERELPHLLGSSEGKYVLIHDDRILGSYDSEADAIGEGYAKLGNIPFMVKQIAKIDVPQNFVSGLLGV